MQQSESQEEENSHHELCGVINRRPGRHNEQVGGDEPPQCRCLATTTSARQRHDSETQGLLQKKRVHEDPKDHLNQRVPLNLQIILNTDILEHKIKKRKIQLLGFNPLVLG